MSIEGSADNFQDSGGIVVLPQQSGQHQGKQHIRKLLRCELVGEGIGPDPGIPFQDQTQL